MMMIAPMLYSAAHASLAVTTLSAESSAESTTDKWTLVSVLITAVISPILIWVLQNKALRPPRRSRDDSEEDRITTPEGNSFSLEGMSANMVEVLLSMWKRIDEMEETQEQWSRERDEFIRINEELRRHNRALAEGFDEVIDWIDNGAVPPPPSVAHHVRDLVQRAIENGNYDGLTS